MNTKQAADLFSVIQRWVEPALEQVKADTRKALEAVPQQVAAELAAVQRRVDALEKQSIPDVVVDTVQGMDMATGDAVRDLHKQLLRINGNLDAFEDMLLEADQQIKAVEQDVAGGLDDLAVKMEAMQTDAVQGKWLGKEVESRMQALQDKAEGLSVAVNVINETLNMVQYDVEVLRTAEPVQGKDALDIEILPAIDTSKSYPRGTYALHNGGVVRAHQQTHGEKGWETVWNGIAGVEYHVLDERTVTIEQTLTDGRTVEKTVNLPTLVYREQWKASNTYLPGDVVTQAGSMWVCLQYTDGVKPGNDDTVWRLSVKHGRDLRA